MARKRTHRPSATKRLDVSWCGLAIAGTSNEGLFERPYAHPRRGPQFTGAASDPAPILGAYSVRKISSSESTRCTAALARITQWRPEAVGKQVILYFVG